MVTVIAVAGVVYSIGLQDMDTVIAVAGVVHSIGLKRHGHSDSSGWECVFYRPYKTWTQERGHCRPNAY